ncbi:hypothetical protein [Paracoccus seriniphilus]|uniref:Uncharacterized protein n=1 Tax=Paracoccus seriniphilus TaxID=184748 RepID=A0A239Q325_9RHOB|nr:hypothetical protein [Paracoccus seriniphilus]WCR13225.1 hypothetical protein JHW44_09755 [Paracoccus seriniphilus]SNT76718.1 hypothetical protein SAMN05444959_12525 [Paracoccus seriniphilus]
MKRVAIEFTRGWSRYNPGEIAAFDEAQAVELEKSGFAKRAKKQPAPKLEKLTLEIGDIRDTDAFKEALGEIEREWQRLEEERARLLAEEKRLEGVRAELDQRIDASDPGDFGVVDDKDTAQDGAEPAEPEVKRPAKGGLPKQGR